ncbi:SpoIIE family protein phosphatase [Bacteroidota bacterium]
MLNLTEISSDPFYIQISEQIIQKIIDGEIVPGEELESIGLLAREHHVNKNTVKKAFEELCDAGVAEFKDEFGYYVKDLSEEDMDLLQKQLMSKKFQSINTETIENFYNEVAAKQKFEEELKLARQIQSDLLPGEPLKTECFSISGYIEPSQVVSGDFYDYFKMGEQKYGIVIADACGKGMPAAILISQIQAIMKSEVGNGSPIEDIMKKLNKHMILNSSRRNFTSIFYGLIDCNKRTFTYVNAGQNLPILVKESGSFELLRTNGPALGLIKDFNYKTTIIRFDEKCTVLFYTDGVTETMNGNGEQFGEGRLIENLISNKENEASDIIKYVVNEINLFKSDKYLNDDRTIMVFKYSREYS